MFQYVVMGLIGFGGAGHIANGRMPGHKLASVLYLCVVIAAMLAIFAYSLFYHGPVLLFGHYI